jgi:hypothetical protein
LERILVQESLDDEWLRSHVYDDDLFLRTVRVITAGVEDTGKGPACVAHAALVVRDENALCVAQPVSRIK